MDEYSMLLNKNPGSQNKRQQVKSNNCSYVANQSSPFEFRRTRIGSNGSIDVNGTKKEFKKDRIPTIYEIRHHSPNSLSDYSKHDSPRQRSLSPGLSFIPAGDGRRYARRISDPKKRLNRCNSSYQKFRPRRYEYENIKAYTLGLLTTMKKSKKSEEELQEIMGKSGKNVSKFYNNQNKLIDSMLFLEDILNDEGSKPMSELESSIKLKEVNNLVKISFFLNMFISSIQTYVAVKSKSLSLFATMSDSFMDLMSSGILLVAKHAAENHDSLNMNAMGKSKIETLSVIIFSTVMGMLSAFLIFNSVEALFGNERSSNMTIWSTLLMLLVITCKMTFFLVCYKHRTNQSIKVLMMDCRNDFIVNSFGLMMALLGSVLVWWIDPLGCLLAAVLILRTWVNEAVGKFVF
ncbi:Metal tolerance protein 4 [Smittium culicis]|uniref:Metal tolerance protein 4 n=1 Tax=Smittium culicis TaxID=133412 RepID=A0A1R1Y086_9FUNG|nr:Metal tolerance protein 4 [Smittium culicis]